MANKIRFDTKRIGADAGRVDAAIKEMQRTMKDMQSKCRQLDTMWDGTASDAFKKAFWDDMNMLFDVIKELQQIHSFEITAKKKYENCEKKVAQTVAGIRV